MLYRKIENLIEEHLKTDSKKILLVDGARQVGKTFIIRYVSQKLFENFIISCVEENFICSAEFFQNHKLFCLQAFFPPHRRSSAENICCDSRM